ncbi:BatA domain-containing protein, partial [Candidatus Woesearchaeota archaeon]|nr:BatA domain-containing protein [Candidatus Woesearchaeota archaeon]
MAFLSFDNPMGWYAFGSVAFLVLLYLIRPKLMDLKIPSVMFLMQDEDKARRSTFFRRFISSLLFFLQLLALLLLSLAVTAPSMQVEYDSTAENTVIVLDVSASMQGPASGVGASDRFHQAVDLALENARGKVSLILIENKPLIVLEGGTEEKAKDILRRLTPKETRSNIGDAILLAGDLLKSNEGRVLVISDFLSTEGTDPDIAKNVLEQRGIIVDLVKVKGSGKNAGIIDMKVTARETKVIVKNFNDEPASVQVEVKNEKGFSKTFPRDILPASVESITFDTMQGATTVEILDKDDLASDNIAYLTNPVGASLKALLIANTPDQFIQKALESGGFAVDVAEPPVIPDLSGFDLLILGDFDKLKLLPGTMRDIRKLAESGIPLVITASNQTRDIDYHEMLPVRITGWGGDTAIITSVENQFTKDIDFGETEEYAMAEPADASRVTVIARAADSSPLLASWDIGDGKVFYYGIVDTASGFKGSTSYPIFWNTL